MAGNFSNCSKILSYITAITEFTPITAITSQETQIELLLDYVLQKIPILPQLQALEDRDRLTLYIPVLNLSYIAAITEFKPITAITIKKHRLNCY